MGAAVGRGPPFKTHSFAQADLSGANWQVSAQRARRICCLGLIAESTPNEMIAIRGSIITTSNVSPTVISHLTHFGQSIQIHINITPTRGKREAQLP